MMLAQVQAFNEGVRAVLRIASASADTIEGLAAYKPTRAGSAVAALRELAEAGEALLLLPQRAPSEGPSAGAAPS
jgi:hypothetical protein